MNVLLLAIMIVFGVAAILTLIRVVRGPSILDRAVASDVLLTEVMCVIGAEMAINGHTRSIPVMLIIAAIGIPLVLLYTAGVYYFFKGKVKLERESY